MDSFLQTIRQRFSIPGGTCSFDLPHLHFWLNQPLAHRQTEMTQWLSHIDLLSDAISLLLSFLRQRCHFVAQTASNGFFQGDSEDKSELIRVRLPQNATVYPTLSGNKYRFALRFMQMNGEHANTATGTIEFEMAACR